MTDYATVAEASPQVEDAAAIAALDRQLVHGVHHRGARRRR